MRRRVYHRSLGRCGVCGKSHRYGRYGYRHGWEIDHKRPQSKGGGDRLRNLHLACTSCNRARGDRSLREARRLIGRPKRWARRKRRLLGWAWFGLLLTLYHLAGQHLF